MSIQELIARNQRGLPLSGKQPIYNVADGDSDDDMFAIAVNRMQNMDLAEREALHDQLQAEIGRLKGQAEQYAAQAKKAQEAAALAADEEKFKQFQERLKKSQEDQKTPG